MHVAGKKCQYVKVEGASIKCEIGINGNMCTKEAVVSGQIVIEQYGDAWMSMANFSFLNPIVNRFSPVVGPESGGTKIKIVGHFVGFKGDEPKVYIGEVELKCKPNKELQKNEAFVKFEEFVCEIGRLPKGKHNLTMTTGGDRHNQTFGPFEIKVDPTITSVSSDKMFKKDPWGHPVGGNPIYVNGTNLDIIQEPRIRVYYGNKTCLSEPCIASSSTTMVCQSPPIVTHKTEGTEEYLRFDFEMQNMITFNNYSDTHNQRFVLKYPKPNETENETLASSVWGWVALPLILLICILSGIYWKYRLNSRELDKVARLIYGSEDLKLSRNLRKKYEFPLSKLKIEEKLLDDGEFGSVFKAKAKNILKDKANTIVAYKIPKQMDTKSDRKVSFTNEVIKLLSLSALCGRSTFGHTDVVFCLFE